MTPVSPIQTEAKGCSTAKDSSVEHNQCHESSAAKVPEMTHSPALQPTADPLRGLSAAELGR